MPIRATYEIQCDGCHGLIDERFDTSAAADRAAIEAGWDAGELILCPNCRPAV